VKTFSNKFNVDVYDSNADGKFDIEFEFKFEFEDNIEEFEEDLDRQSTGLNTPVGTEEVVGIVDEHEQERRRLIFDDLLMQQVHVDGCVAFSTSRSM
jgi:hypothetical protein